MNIQIRHLIDMSRRVYKLNTPISIKDYSTEYNFGSYLEYTAGISTQNASGFSATAFYSGKNIVIAFAGTKPSSFKDLTADAKLAFSVNPKQESDALFYSQGILRDVSCDEVIFTGHSLGGFLAQRTAKALDCPFVAFNPAGGKMLSLKKNISRIFTNKPRTHVEGINVCFKNDPVSSIMKGRHFGRMVYVEDLVGVKSGFVKAHSLKSLKDAFANSNLQVKTVLAS